MCEAQTKLVAWLDGELPAEEAANLERHVEVCKECRTWLAAFKQVSETFDAYCDALMVAKTRRRVPRWVPVLASASIAAVALFLAFSWTHIAPPPTFTPTIAAASVAVPAPPAVKPAPETTRRKTIRKRPAFPPAQMKAVKWQPTETAVQIAIPVDAMFPPGAMPKGMNFIAELSIAPDGSVRQVRLRQ